ncbi:MAG: flagellar basal body P-ring protein FlgI [Casimicrobiaceae bacterium]
MARIDPGAEQQLVGYGIVVGLDGSGDSRSSTFTMQSVGNMLTRLGVTVPEGQVRVKNVAAVMVVARMQPYQRRGSRFDVSVSSLGDAKSLEGGTLLYTPLATPEGLVYASAQGPVSVGGFSARGGDSKVAQNYVLVGRVPGGGAIESEWNPPRISDGITVVLDEPDFTTALRVASAINRELGGKTARAIDAGTIQVPAAATRDSSLDGRAARVTLLARIESLDVEPDIAARLVVNERTGTIVAGEHVSIASVAVAHGNLSVKIDSKPVVSQPRSLAHGETVVAQENQVEASEDGGGLYPLQESASVGDLARALNALGVGPRDMIAIFQALKEAGALRAELRIL